MSLRIGRDLLDGAVFSDVAVGGQLGQQVVTGVKVRKISLDLVRWVGRGFCGVVGEG